MELRLGHVILEGLTACNNQSKPQCFPLFRVLHSGILVHYIVLEIPSLSVIVPGSSLDCESLIDFLGYEVT